MKIVESFITKNRCYTNKTPLKVKGLMLHSVGCAQPKAFVFVKSENDPNKAVAVHAFIDAEDGTVYQTLPWEVKAWHCGGSGNGTHIGVEMCEPADMYYTGGATFAVVNRERAQLQAMTAYNSAVELFAMLCTKFALDPMKDGVIISHNEGHQRGLASNHSDPEHLWKGLGMSLTMNGFRQAVADKMEENEMTQEKFNEMMDTYLAQKASLAVSNWADASWTAATASGLTDGKRPQSFCTRQELIQILSKAEEKK